MGGGIKSKPKCLSSCILFCQWEVRVQSLYIQHPEFSLTQWRVPASAAVSHTSQEGSAHITVLLPHNFLRHPHFQMTSFSHSIIGTTTQLLYSTYYLNLPFFCQIVQQPMERKPLYMRIHTYLFLRNIGKSSEPSDCRKSELSSAAATSVCSFLVLKSCCTLQLQHIFAPVQPSSTSSSPHPAVTFLHFLLFILWSDYLHSSF